MAFVIVMHLSPDHESMLGEILQRASRSPVVTVVESLVIRANHVYVISPSLKLTMDDGHLLVAPLTTLEGRRHSIDLFFRSLAEAHRERAVCIVLSGTGADGSEGLKRIKELGGVALAQDPADAEFDAMPTSAIQTGLIDFTMPAEEMGPKLVDLWTNARAIELPNPPSMLEVVKSEGIEAALAEEALLSIKALLRERTGHDFAHYKRGTVLRRLERRMQVTAVPDLPSYRRLLDAEPKETPALLQDMLISVTNFFRDPDAFASIGNAVKDALEERPQGKAFRAWVAGCATGEEAYSVAMMLHELLADRGIGLQVFASDIDQRAVASARTGLYPNSIETDVSADRVRRFFSREPSGLRVDKSLRDSVVFSAHNVLSDPPFTRVDLICCRNLLIYLDRSGQAQLLKSIHFALNPRGLLFLGSSESTDAVNGLFEVVDKANRIYRANPAVARARTMPPISFRMPSPVVTSMDAIDVLVEKPPLELLHERVVRHHGTPTVLLDADETVLHVGEGSEHLLRVAAGAPSNKLLDLARTELRSQLRAVLARATELGQPVQSRCVQLSINGQTRQVVMTARPVLDESPVGLMLVAFEEFAESMSPADGGGAQSDPVVDVLETELRRAQERLRSVAGESAASTEELRASNEELQTINEELRSTTEELETSQEELQSTNEELTTVNVELTLKVDETERMHDDLENLMASADIGSVFVDREMRVRRFTPQTASFMKLLPSDAGRTLTDIRHRLDYPELESDTYEAMRMQHRVEREVSADDGRWFLARILPYRTSDNRVDGAALAFVDITARRNADDSLRLNEQHMRLVAESMRDYAILTMDPQGVVVSWSRGAQRIFGYEPEETIGKSFNILFTAEDQANGEPDRELREARYTGRSDNDRWLLKKDGSRIYCNGMTTPMIDSGLIGFAKIARDFTREAQQYSERERELMEEQAARARLQEIAAMKDEFLAVMSHELKNPLAIIQMNAQLLERNPALRGEQRAVKSTRAIMSAVSSQAQIINDLLELSRLNTGKVTLNPTRLDLTDVVTTIIGALSPDVDAKKQTLAFDSIGPLWVHADPIRAEQIVWNLLTNAVKFTPEGGSIGARLALEGSMVVFSVVDSGIGIEGTELANVFEMFRQVDAGKNRRKTGLGIGLALVKQLAELHGGRVEARSKGLGHGAQFVVWLPIAGFIEQDAADTVRVRDRMENIQLLLLDDESELVDAFADLVRDEGASVDTTHSATEALTLARTKGYDAVISDVAMPEHDGYWFAREIRGDPQLAELVLIAVSGMDRLTDRQLAVEAGFDAHIGKPIDLDQLKGALLQALRKRRAET